MREMPMKKRSKKYAYILRHRPGASIPLTTANRHLLRLRPLSSLYEYWLVPLEKYKADSKRYIIRT